MKTTGFENLSYKKFSIVALVFSLVLSFVLYGNTLNHDFALDDAIVITKNEFTKQGISGISDIFSYDSFTGFFGKQKKLVEGGRYRPLSLAIFAVEYELFGENPFIGHLGNIITYALLCWLIIILAMKVFSNKLFGKILYYASFISGLIFLIHPIHTEVVANIKGRDELLSLLFSLLAMYFSFQYLSNKRKLYLIGSAVAIFLGCLAKENAITFVLIIPIVLWFLKPKENKAVFSLFFSLFIPALLFLYIRNSVLGGFSIGEVSELMNNPFYGATTNEKYATILYTWLLYLKLLLFPHPLTYDYYPYHIALNSFSNITPWISILLLLSLLYFLYKIITKRSVLVPLIIGFILSFSVVSNLLFPVGIFMNERFVFMPSFFWSLILGFILVPIVFEKEKSSNRLIVFVFLAFMGTFYPLKTISRNKVWNNDLTLFLADVKTSSNSAKSNCTAGGKIWEKSKTISNEQEKVKLLRQSEGYLRKSLEVYPDYTDAWLLLGNVLFDNGKRIKEAGDCYMQVLRRQSQNENAWKNIDIILQSSEDRELQLNFYNTLNKVSSNRYLINYRLGVLYGRYFGDLNQGILYLEKAVSIDKTKVQAVKDLGTAYGMAGDKENAYKYFKIGVAMAPDDEQLLINMSIACRQLNKIEEALRYEKMIQQLKSN